MSGECALFMESLWFAYSSFIAKVVDWMHGNVPCRSTDSSRGAGERRIVAVTVDLHPEGLLLVAAGFAIWFMLWALWHWWKEEKRKSYRDGLNPRERWDPSSAARDERR